MAIRFVASVLEKVEVEGVACAEKTGREVRVRQVGSESQSDHRGMALARSDGWLTVENQVTSYCHWGEETHRGSQGIP